LKIYANERKEPGASYIAFLPQQIKSATLDITATGRPGARGRTARKR
jgi:hypothetical protein